MESRGVWGWKFTRRDDKTLGDCINMHIHMAAFIKPRICRRELGRVVIHVQGIKRKVLSTSNSGGL